MERCDGYNEIHDPIIISENNEALRVYCRNCRKEFATRMDARGRQDRLYRELFIKDYIQPPHNQYFRLHGKTMSIV